MLPKVICHIMSSVDGRLLPDRWTEPADKTSKNDCFGIYASLSRSLDADAWMFGKSTAAEKFPYRFASKGVADFKGEKVYKASRHSERLFITVDPDANIYYTHNQLKNCDILVILGSNATTDYLGHLEEKGISYIVMKRAEDLRHGLELVGEHFGVRTISLQGGGIINGAMLAEGLLNELSLVIYPGIDGKSGIPSIFEYVGNKDVPAEGQTLELTSSETLSHGIIWLKYKIKYE